MLSGKCNKCDRKGHYAKDCPQPLTCTRCGVKGHLSWKCPSRNYDVCGKKGHDAKDCESRGAASKGSSCYQCGETGHMAFACPQRQQERKRKLPAEMVAKRTEVGQFQMERAKAQFAHKAQATIRRMVDGKAPLGRLPSALPCKPSWLPSGVCLVQKGTAAAVALDTTSQDFVKGGDGAGDEEGEGGAVDSSQFAREQGGDGGLKCLDFIAAYGSDSD